MELEGKNFIGSKRSAQGKRMFTGVNPANGDSLKTDFVEASEAELDQAVHLASQAFAIYKNISGEQKAVFLETIAQEILALGTALTDRACAETALPEGRIVGERGRTIGQLRLFASLLREGSWVNARIDEAMPDREPMPRVDIRSMLRPLGPVAVFGASNFPLAFSVAGGDTVSALAAGCPVVVKGHPAHPGTCELIASAILTAAEKTGMPNGVFSLLQGSSHQIGLGLVKHPMIQAVGFTGSLQGGKALFDAANTRETPIPVYAEMGSTNPVFILPEAMDSQSTVLSDQLFNSFTLGVGQFCTKPGIVVYQESESARAFEEKLVQMVTESQGGSMLTASINKGFEYCVEKFKDSQGVRLLAKGTKKKPRDTSFQLWSTDGTTFLSNKALEEEVFGPATILVKVNGPVEMNAIAQSLHGHLTATIHATDRELGEHFVLLDTLETKVGRLLVNGFPTGVEVCDAMVHGGPYPASTDARSTSVGTLAIERFTRQVCYQNFPDISLPEALKKENPLGITRTLNGKIDKK